MVEGVIPPEPVAAPEFHDLVSPVSGERLDLVRIASSDEIARSFADLARPTQRLGSEEVFAFLERLRVRLDEHQDAFVEKVIMESGFVRQDARDLIVGSIEYLRDFARYAEDRRPVGQTLWHSYRGANERAMRITHRPFRCVAAVVPQNASLPLAITIIASALYAGSRVVVRPSLQCAATGLLLADLVERSAPPKDSVRIVHCLASRFLDACFASEHVDLIHYIGSNEHAIPVFVKSFVAKKMCLLDGQGNGLLYVDEGFPVEAAARIITTGGTRFNGETCTSVNGVLAHPSVFEELRDAVVESFRSLRVGHPGDPDTQVGPLFSATQADRLRVALGRETRQRLLCGGDVRGAYFTPAVVEGVAVGDTLAREGVFGPAVWIRSVSHAEAIEAFRTNQFPLSDTVLSPHPERVREFASRSRAARICANEDPSIESMFEPWGGYPPSGLNPVSVWIDKYRQAYQLDGPPEVLRRALEPEGRA
jgi:acyl-CoA reductase-like NAD-dependent aldehyde dehydrogenase